MGVSDREQVEVGEDEGEGEGGWVRRTRMFSGCEERS